MNAAMGLDSMKEMGGMGPFSESDFKGIGSVTMDDLAKAGRFGDKFLAHVADGEMVLPKPFLDQNPYIKDKIYQEMDAMGIKPADFTVNGGDLTNVNPKTGMPEFGFFSKAFKAVKKVVKKAANVVLPVAATVACGGNPACGAAASAALTKAQGGSWGDALKSAAFTYAGQSFAQGMGANLGTEGVTGFDAIKQNFSFYDTATGDFYMPQVLQGTGTYGATPGANPVQSFFQSAGGAVKGALTPGMTMQQGWQGSAAQPGIGGMLKATDISNLSQPMQQEYLTYFNENLASGMSQEQAVNDALMRTTGVIRGDIPASSAQASLNIQAAKPGAPNWIQQAAQDTIKQTAAGGGQEDSGILGALSGSPYLAAAAVAVPALATYVSAQEPIPENEMVKYDETARQEIQAYNQCVAAGGGNCSVPTDLKPVTTDYNISGDPNSLYNRFRAAKQAGVAPQGYGIAAAAPKATNVLDLYKQFAARPTPTMAAPQTKYGLAALLAADGGHIAGPGTGTSDDIPAMLSDGEFVMTAKAVRGAGNGSRQDGVKKMYNMMRQFEGAA